MLNNYQLFYSIGECIDALDNSEEIPYRDKSSEEHRGNDWCDTYDYEEARMYMLEGRVYDKLGAEIEKYRTKGTATKRVSELSVVGHNVVVPLYLQGIPTNMINSKSKINNKIVTIFYSCKAPHYVSRSDLEDGASRLFKNIISLEEQGYRVNLFVGECFENFGFAIRLKTDRETLNLKKMCFPLVSSSFLRRIGFRVKERLFKDWIGGGYGSGVFRLEDYDKFMTTVARVRNYEIWDYQGKKK